MHVSAYIAHVRTQLKQTIPKAIVHCLVSQFPSTGHSNQNFKAVQLLAGQPEQH